MKSLRGKRMKPVHCVKIAAAHVEGVCWHREGQLALEAEGSGVSWC